MTFASSARRVQNPLRRVHVELVLRWSATLDACWASSPWDG
ncbi:hypothetical protein ACIF80_14600 [Streptomyces sp. NPDC085927]